MELFSKSKDIFFSNFNNICRTCIKTKTEEPLHHIFDSEIVILNECHRTSEVLSAVSTLKMQPDDDLPKSICIQCLDSLTKAYNFQKMCKLSDLCMRSAIHPNEPHISPKKVPTDEPIPHNNSQSDVELNSCNHSLINPSDNQSGIKILYPESPISRNIQKLDEKLEHEPCMQRAIISIEDENINKSVSAATLAALSDPSYSVETNVAESGMEIIIIPSKKESDLKAFSTESLPTAGCHVDLSNKTIVPAPCIQSTAFFKKPQIISEKLPTLSMPLSICNQLQSIEEGVLDSNVQDVVEPNENKTFISCFPTSVFEQCTQTSSLSSQEDSTAFLNKPQIISEKLPILSKPLSICNQLQSIGERVLESDVQDVVEPNENKTFIRCFPTSVFEQCTQTSSLSSQEDSTAFLNKPQIISEKLPTLSKPLSICNQLQSIGERVLDSNVQDVVEPNENKTFIRVFPTSVFEQCTQTSSLSSQEDSTPFFKKPQIISEKLPTLSMPLSICNQLQSIEEGVLDSNVQDVVEPNENKTFISCFPTSVFEQCTQTSSLSSQEDSTAFLNKPQIISEKLPTLSKPLSICNQLQSIGERVLDSNVQDVVEPNENKTFIRVFPTSVFEQCTQTSSLSSQEDSIAFLNKPQIISEKLPTLSMPLSICNQLQSIEERVLDSNVQDVVEPNENKTFISCFPTSFLEQCTQTSSISSQDDSTGFLNKPQIISEKLPTLSMPLSICNQLQSIEERDLDSNVQDVVEPNENKTFISCFPTSALEQCTQTSNISSQDDSTAFLNKPQIILEKLPTLSMPVIGERVLDSNVQDVVEPNENKTFISCFPTSVLEQCTQTSNISSQDDNSIKILSNKSLTTGSNSYQWDETGVLEPTIPSPMSVSVAEIRTKRWLTDNRSQGVGQYHSDEEDISTAFDEDGDIKVSNDAADLNMMENEIAKKEELVANEEICNKNIDSIHVKKEVEEDGEEVKELEEEVKEEEAVKEEDEDEEEVEGEVKEEVDEEIVEEVELKEYEEEVEAKGDTIIQEIEKPNPRNKRNGCYTCEICGKAFDRQHRLNRHANLHKKEGKPFECEFCKKRFALEAYLQKHFITHEKSFLEKTERLKNSIDGYQCPECPRKFLKQESMASHMRTHRTKSEPSKLFKCEICSKMFDRLYRLTRHKQLHEGNRKYSCDICDKKFGLRSHLIDHLNSHSGLKPHNCHVCEKSFQQASSLKDHLRIHTGEQPFLCAECGRAFNNLSNLRQHQLRHTGVKSFQCPECPSKFISRSGLFSHKNTHRNLKPYVCKTCGSAFTKNYSLKKHERIHTGEKPYKCDYCEMRFNTADHMKRHRRKHTGEKPYGCDYCEKKFSQSNDMIKHLRLHLGENVYRCNECDASFRLNSELKKHISEHYKEQLKKGKSTQKNKSKVK